MDQIPVEFDFQGTRNRGYFTEVSGAAGKHWHLMVDDFYLGQMSLTESNGFQFTTQKGEMEKDLGLMEYFRLVLIAWYE
jgi:hypothetical protein